VLALAAAALPAGIARAEEPVPWTQQALQLQYELGSDVEMVNAPWIGTHNSFNSLAEMGLGLSPLDSNQRIDIAGQLDAGMRGLELDVHWFPAVRDLPNPPLVCHATGPHLGCTVEKTLGQVLAEIRDWLRAHPSEVILLYLESHLDTNQGYAAGARRVRDGLGDLLYRPRGSGCRELPDSLTRDDVRAAGAQVIAVGGCGQGPDWPELVHAWSEHHEDQPSGYGEFPACDPDLSRSDYRTRLIRYYEDSTSLSSLTTGGDSRRNVVDVESAGRMARCGVDLIHFDQLTPADPRLEAVVWSWAPGQPRAGRCSEQRESGRWRSRSCAGRRPAACRDGRAWSVSAPVRFARAGRACKRDGGRFAVPRTGYEDELLKRALRRDQKATAWLGQRRAGRAWQPLDRR
jgi:hypothetical protein